MSRFPERLSFGRLAGAVIALSFVLKILLGYLLSGSFFARGNSYHALNALAFSLLERGEFALEGGVPSVDYEPLYPVLLAFGYGLPLPDWLGVTLLQALLHGATSWLLFLIGRTLFGAAAGLVAASWHAFYPYLFFHSLSVVDTTQFIFAACLLLYVVLRAWRDDRQWRGLAAAGALTGLAFLSRGSAAAMMPVMALYALVRFSQFSMARRVALFVLPALIVAAPWLTRNYALTGEIFISTHGPFGLWQGNNERSYDYLRRNVSLDEVYRSDPPEIYRKYPLRPREPREALFVAGQYREAALDFIREDTGRFLELAAMKGTKFWSWTYNPVMKSYRYGSNDLRQTVYFISYVPLLIGLPFGLRALYRRDRGVFLLFAGVILCYTAAHMVAMGFSRARLPLDPFLMILLGAAATSRPGRGAGREDAEA